MNGTISHAQLIDSLPDQDAKNIDNIAQDILKSSSYLLHSYCRSSDISNKDCVKFMTQYQLPETMLRDRCVKEVEKTKYHSYRRLLPANYKDGIQKVSTTFMQIITFSIKVINFKFLVPC